MKDKWKSIVKSGITVASGPQCSKCGLIYSPGKKCPRGCNK